jgi:hypothetical protein
MRSRTGAAARSMAATRSIVGFTTLAALVAPTPCAYADGETTAPRPRTYPLVLLVQTDAVVDSTPAGAGVAAGDDPLPGSAARLRRLRVGEDASSGDWRARVTLEATNRDRHFTPVEGDRIPVGGPVRLTEAFAAWTPHRAFSVAAGAQRVPFSLSRQVDEADLRLPERAQILAALAPDYRAGVSVTSDLGLLNLRIAGMSADTSLDGRLFTSGAFGALRLGADPIGPMGVTPWRRRTNDPWYCWWRFSAGLSLVYGTLLESRTLALGGDAQLQWRRVTVTGEYLGEHLGAGNGSWAHQGAVVEPGIFLSRERIELVLRGAWYRQTTALAATPDATDTFAAGAGLTFFGYANHVRLQAALELRRTRDAALPDSDWAIMRATLLL